MRVLRRYITGEIISATLLVLLAFLGLFAFFDLINELGDIGKGDYRLQHAALFVLLTVPGHVYELMPIAALIGAVYALAQLAAHSEVTVMRISGLSTWRALATVLRIGLMFALITFAFGEVVAPQAERAAQALRLKALTSVIAQEFRSGLWVKDDFRFVNVREVKPDSRLVGVKIYEFDSDYRLQSISYAEQGEYLPPNSWRLTGVTRTVLGQGGQSSRGLAEFVLRAMLPLPPPLDAGSAQHGEERVVVARLPITEPSRGPRHGLEFQRAQSAFRV